jgi:hypothetical protein
MKDWPGGASVRIIEGQEAVEALLTYADERMIRGMVAELARNPHLRVVADYSELDGKTSVITHLIRLFNPDWKPGIAVYYVDWPIRPTHNEICAMEDRLIELSKGQIRQSQEQLRRWGM